MEFTALYVTLLKHPESSHQLPLLLRYTLINRVITLMALIWAGLPTEPWHVCYVLRCLWMQHVLQRWRLKQCQFRLKAGTSIVGIKSLTCSKLYHVSLNRLIKHKGMHVAAFVVHNKDSRPAGWHIRVIPHSWLQKEVYLYFLHITNMLEKINTLYVIYRGVCYLTVIWSVYINTSHYTIFVSRCVFRKKKASIMGYQMPNPYKHHLLAAQWCEIIVM